MAGEFDPGPMIGQIMRSVERSGLQGPGAGGSAAGATPAPVPSEVSIDPQPNGSFAVAHTYDPAAQGSVSASSVPSSSKYTLNNLEELLSHLSQFTGSGGPGFDPRTGQPGPWPWSY